MTLKFTSFKSLRLITFGIVMSLFSLSMKAQFTNGNIVVLQVGDGVQTLANTGNTLILKEYTPTGTPAFSVTIPSTGTNALAASGTATSEGLISLAADDSSIIIPGYNIAIPHGSSLSGATSATVPRGIGQVDGLGNYILAATTTTAFSGNNIRSAAGDGLGNYWASGANTGIAYFGNTAAPATVFNTPTNNRSLQIFQGNLLYSTGSGAARGIYGGLGLPTTASISAQIMPTLATNSPYCFAFNPANDTVYVADDAAFTGPLNQAGGIQKYYFNGASWVFMYTLQCGNGSLVGARGLVADFSGPRPVLYATTADGTANRLIKITDSSLTAGNSAVLLATAPANTIFRGVCFSPKTPCVPVSVANVIPDSSVCSGTNLTLTVTPSGSGPFTYSWTGPNGFTSSAQNPVISTIASNAQGTYNVLILGACGNVGTSVDITVNPTVTPMITVAEMPILGPNLATGGTASASTTYMTNNPSDAFDGDTITTGWGSANGGVPAWLEYDFGAGNGKTINAYSFYCSSNMTGGWNGNVYGPQDWTFEAYNGASWDTLDTHFTSGTQDDKWYTFRFANSNSYEKYRIHISASIDMNYTMITELRLSDTSYLPKCANKEFFAELGTGALFFPIDSTYWSVNNLATTTSGSFFSLPSFNKNDTVKLTLMTSYGCSTLSTASSNNYVVLSGASSSTTNVTICSGDSIIVAGNSYNTTGIYNDTLVNSYGCDSIIVTNLTVNSAINTGTTTVSNTITASASAASYQWIDCNNGNLPIAGETNQSYTATGNGDYAVIVTIGSCSDTSACVNISGIGISSYSNANEKISVYPNPNNGSFTIKSSLKGQFHLINTLGQSVKTFSFENKFNEMRIEGLENGIYYLINLEYGINFKVAVSH